MEKYGKFQKCDVNSSIDWAADYTPDGILGLILLKSEILF